MPVEPIVIDLTQPLVEKMPVSIGFPPFMLTRYMDRERGDVATVEIMLTGLHTGTHVDAPMHFINGGACVDELGSTALCGTAVVVDVPGDGSWAQIGPAELDSWEQQTGETVRAGDIVLLRSGHARYWAPVPEGRAYMTTPWPFLNAEGAQWLVGRGIKVLGVECPDPDKVDQRELSLATFPAHKALLGAGIPIVENLANLDKIPRTRFEFRALSLLVSGASASPIRALALIDPDVLASP